MPAKEPAPAIPVAAAEALPREAAIEAINNTTDDYVRWASVMSPVTQDAQKTAESGLDNIKWRCDVWGKTLGFAMESPLLGKGFGVYPNYSTASPSQYLRGSIYLKANIIPVHNHILTIFFKMGLFGLGLFFFINIYVFVYAVKYIGRCNAEITKSLLIGLLGAFVCWHVLALFFDVIDSPPTSVFLWIIMGAIFAVVESDKSNPR